MPTNLTLITKPMESYKPPTSMNKRSWATISLTNKRRISIQEDMSFQSTIHRWLTWRTNYYQNSTEKSKSRIKLLSVVSFIALAWILTIESMSKRLVGITFMTLLSLRNSRWLICMRTTFFRLLIISHLLINMFSLLKCWFYCWLSTKDQFRIKWNLL